MPSSPVPSDDESNPTRPNRPTGFPGATGLKYTTTILGPSRAGGMGMRVSGKRGSISASRRQSVRRSLSQPRPIAEDVGEKVEPDATPTLPASSSPLSTNVARRIADVEIKVDEASPIEKEPVGAATTSAQPSPTTTPGANPPPANAMIPIPFIPKFKGAAEMEARRQLRMRNRVPPGDASRAQVPAPAYLNPELSSSSSSSALSVSDVEDSVIPEGDEEDDDDDDDDDLDDEDNVPDDTVDLMGDDVFDPLVRLLRIPQSFTLDTNYAFTESLQVVGARCLTTCPMACHSCQAHNP